MCLAVFVINYFITCSQELKEGKMTYTDISGADQTFDDYTSFADYNSTMNFLVGAYT